MARYGMVIDLKRCIACYACAMACKAANHTPPGIFWANVLRGERGKYPTVTRQPLPTLCMQCSEPECEQVCPTKATQKRADGIVTIDPALCVGCKYCIVACPYSARYFHAAWTDYFTNEEKPSSSYGEFAKKDWMENSCNGIATKCHFCKDRAEKSLKPACVDACPTEARTFGDLDDPESEVSLLIKKSRGFQLNPEFGTDPSVFYLPSR